MAPHYDRGAEDLDNIVMLEHLNLQVADQTQATQSRRHYKRGGDAWSWELPRENTPLPDMPPIASSRAAALAERRARRPARGM